MVRENIFLLILHLISNPIIAAWTILSPTMPTVRRFYSLLFNNCSYCPFSDIALSIPVMMPSSAHILFYITHEFDICRYFLAPVHLTPIPIILHIPRYPCATPALRPRYPMLPPRLPVRVPGSRPLFPQWSHHVYPQFLPGGHPAHRHSHCKLDCGQHVNNNAHAHARIANYHRAHAGKRGLGTFAS